MPNFFFSSRLRGISMYYNLASTTQQKDFQAKQFINATADTIDELSFTMQAEIQALRKENEELRAEFESLKAQVEAQTKQDPFLVDFTVSKPSVKKAQKNLMKEIQKEISR